MINSLRGPGRPLRTTRGVAGRVRPSGPTDVATDSFITPIIVNHVYSEDIFRSPNK